MHVNLSLEIELHLTGRGEGKMEQSYERLRHAHSHHTRSWATQGLLRALSGWHLVCYMKGSAG